MSVTFRGYVGEVVIIEGQELFYTLDPNAEGHLWRNYDLNLLKRGIPKEAYCWWLDSNDEVTYDGRRRMI